MSIVTLLKNEEFPELKYYIKSNVPRKSAFVSNKLHKPFSKTEIRVKYGDIEPYQARRIGNISDYMFCLVLAKTVKSNKREIYESLNWRAMELFCGCIKSEDKKYYMQEVVFEKALKKTEEFINGMNVSIKEVIQAAYTIYKMEDYLHYISYYSKEQFLSNFLEPCENDVVEQVVHMIRIFEEQFIESGLVCEDSVVISHPWFDPWSSKCGGGVADVYIDGFIYDFKSTKEIGYHWDEVGQVYAYYLLNCLCKKDYEHEKELYINAPLADKDVIGIGLYFSRYGIIEKCSLAESGVLVSAEDVCYLEDMINKYVNKK